MSICLSLSPLIVTFNCETLFSRQLCIIFHMALIYPFIFILLLYSFTYWEKRTLPDFLEVMICKGRPCGLNLTISWFNKLIYLPSCSPYCGTDKPDSVVTSQRGTTVKLSVSPSIHYKGFNCTATAVNQ